MTTRLKVAVLFFGQPRNIQNRLSAFSHRFWLRKHDVDYFGHCWYDESSPSYSAGENAGLISIPQNAPQIIRNQYPNISLSIEKPIDFTNDTRISDYLRGMENSDQNSKLRSLLPIFLSQYYSISQAVGLVSDEAIPKYDFVILSRYDNLLLKVPDLVELPINKLIASNSRAYFADLLFIGQLSHIKALNVLPRISQLLENEPDVSPEELKRAAFLQEFSTEDAELRYMNISLIREPSLLHNLLFILKQIRIKLLKRLRLKKG